MKKLLLCVALLVCWTGLAYAEKFDCEKLPFGKDLSEFNKEDQFVKYKEKDGISYYNYAGSCVIEQQKKLNPAIAYAFVDNKLYARFITIFNNDDANADKDMIVANISKQLGAKPDASYEDGDWSVISWNVPGKQQQFKMKFNTKTKMSKSAYYYTSLRPNENADKLLSNSQ